jgi:hypothetical protein
MLRLALVIAWCAGCHEPASKPTTSPAPPPAPEVASGSAPGKPKGLAGWELPAKWRSEVIPFPLDFAPALAHRGYEELRFPPGFFDPAAGGYWSYAFVWRTDDEAVLEAGPLGDELTAYFRGLIAAVDDKQRITARDQIVVHAEAQAPGRFGLTAHVFDAFKTAQPLDLTGWAERRACGKRGALWIFMLARPESTIRAQLDAVAAGAKC